MKYLKILLGNLNNTDVGLLVMRVTFGGIMYYSHGHGKLFAGVDRWHGLGGALSSMIGLEYFQTFFGLMASLSESIFALFIVVGLLTRISSSLLGFTMLIATLRHVFDGILHLHDPLWSWKTQHGSSLPFKISIMKKK